MATMTSVVVISSMRPHSPSTMTTSSRRMGSVSAIWRPASRFEAEDCIGGSGQDQAGKSGGGQEARAIVPDLQIAEHGEDESGVDNDEQNNDHAPHKLKLSAGTAGAQVVGHGDVITQDTGNRSKQ